VGAFDAEGGWEVEGATSMTAWLRHRGAQTGRDASRLARTARRLRRLPLTASAYRRGSLSSGQVAAIVANLSERTVELFAEGEEELLPHLVELEVADLARAMQLWRQRAEALLPDPEPPAAPKRELHHSQTLDGRWESTASWDPEGGAVIDAALGLASSPDAEGEEPRSASQRAGDALVDVCRWFLQHHPGGVERRRRPDVDVIVNLDDLEAGVGRQVGGVPLDAATVRRLLCDCGIHRVVTSGASTILDYGRATRTVPPSLWAALVLRDRHCRHPGCDRRPDWCEAHHHPAWSEGGVTSLATTVLACSRHHHLWHSPGWRLKLLADGELHITTPEGQVLVSRPPPLVGPG
jgi:hypothetical protein